MKSIAVRLLEVVWLPVLFVAVWWFASDSSDSFYFPPLRKIVERLGNDWFFEQFFSDLVPSLVIMLVGFLIAVIVGCAAGILVGLVGWLYDATSPLINFARSVPPVMLLPPAIILFGFGDSMRVGVIVFGAVWPTLLGTIDGVRSFDLVKSDVLRTFRISRSARLVRAVLPNAMPQILSGASTSLQFSLIMLVISETMAASRGVGFRVMQAQRSFDVVGTWSGTLLLGLVGVLFGLCFHLARRRLIRWWYLRETQAA